jgi:hypothetical protein
MRKAAQSGKVHVGLARNLADDEAYRQPEHFTTSSQRLHALRAALSM